MLCFLNSHQIKSGLLLTLWLLLLRRICFLFLILISSNYFCLNVGVTVDDHFKRCEPDSSQWKFVDCCCFCLILPHMPPAFSLLLAGRKGLSQTHVPAGINGYFICGQLVGEWERSVQEASKLTGSMKQELSKEISSLGFGMKWVTVLDLGFASSGPVLNLDLLTGLQWAQMNLKLCQSSPLPLLCDE